MPNNTTPRRDLEVELANTQQERDRWHQELVIAGNTIRDLEKRLSELEMQSVELDRERRRWYQEAENLARQLRQIRAQTAPRA